MHASLAGPVLQSISGRALFGALLAAVWLCAAGPVIAAGDQRPGDWMDPPDLRSTFSGATITGNYRDGRTFTESYLRNGRLKYTEKMRRRTQVGHWSVVAGSFCTIYDLNPTGGCFKVRRHSGNCFEFYFLTRTETQARKPDTGRPSWSARAWRTDRPSTCNEKPSV